MLGDCSAGRRLRRRSFLTPRPLFVAGRQAFETQWMSGGMTLEVTDLLDPRAQEPHTTRDVAAVIPMQLVRHSS